MVNALGRFRTWTENPRVGGSIPPLATIIQRVSGVLTGRSQSRGSAKNEAPPGSAPGRRRFGFRNEQGRAPVADHLQVQHGLNPLPPRRWVRGRLVAHLSVRIGYLLHHALAREQAGNRRAVITPVPPGIVGPVFVLGTLGGRGVGTKGCEQQRVPFRWCIFNDGGLFVALREACKRIRFTNL